MSRRIIESGPAALGAGGTLAATADRITWPFGAIWSAGPGPHDVVDQQHAQRVSPTTAISGKRPTRGP